MSLKTAKEIWDYLKAEYEEDERIRGIKVLNLISDFEFVENNNGTDTNL